MTQNMTPQVMQKIVVHSPGGYHHLKLEEHPIPQPKEGEVVVRTEAAGINYADCAVRWGLYESAKKYVGWPITPGFEFAGTVESVGPGVSAWQKGQRVFGISFFGGYATHVCVPAHYIFPLPSSFTAAEAAGFCGVYMTAYHALLQNILVRPQMKVLIHSAAGGVGTALLQLGNILNLRMLGVVGSAHKVAVARQFGAEVVVDKSSQDLWQETKKFAPQGFDIVLDANGYSTLKQSYNSLAPTGKLICYGFHSMLPKEGGRIDYLKLITGYLRTPRFNPIEMTNLNRSLVTFNISFLFERRDLLSEGMTAMLKWIDEGKIKPPKISTYALKDVALAHKAIESGQTTGKLILLTA